MRIQIFSSTIYFVSLFTLACQGLGIINITHVQAAQEIKNDNERNFYSVLDDLLGDFEYDLKNNEVSGLKNLAIRNIAISENIPSSFKSHLELLLTERVLRTSKTRMIQCLPCKARKTSLNGNQVSITSPETNPTELARIAKSGGIDHFLDAAFSFQPSGMVLSMYITDPDTGNITWSRSYNSESSRASAFRRGVDYNQLDDARKSTEYTPTLQSRLALYYLFVPSVAQTEGNLTLGYRLMERYDNRKKEVGFEADYMTNASTMVSKTSAPATSLYTAYGFNLTLLFMHAWNLIGEEENYNKVRGSIFCGVGGTYASGYLGGLIRTGYELRLGKHFGTSINLGYRPPSNAFIGNTSSGTVYGLEYGLGINLLF